MLEIEVLACVGGLDWRFMLDGLVDCASWAEQTGSVKGGCALPKDGLTCNEADPV